MSERHDEGGVDGRWLIALLAVAAVGVVAYFSLGMPGMGHGRAPMSDMPGMTNDMAVSVDEFAARMKRPDAFVVNVHVPDEGSIAGTDATIPYDQITVADGLPAEKATPILLYCRTGRMSTEAAAALMAAGFTNVVTLDGGMEAWKAAGRPLR